MEKRTLVALGLILLVLFISNKFIYKPPPAPEQEVTGTVDVDTLTAGHREEPLPESSSAPPTLTEAGEGRLPQDVEIGAARPETTIVRTDRFRLAFSNIGGILLEATLLGYEYFPDGSRVELLAEDQSRFLSMALSSKKDTLDLGNTVFTANRERLELNENRREGSIIFTAAVGAADTVRLTYTFRNDSYLFGALVELPELGRSGEGWKIHQNLGPAFRPTEKDSTKDDFPNIGGVYMLDGKVEEKKMSKFEGWEPEYVKGPLPWVCMRNKYFLFGLIGRSNQYEGVVIRGDKTQKRFEMRPMIALEPGELETNYDIYIGPQDFYQLEKVGLGFEKMVEYGWWIIKPITKLIIVIMLWMHKFIANYGIVIILFSVFTKVIFYPLTKKSLQASKDMQKLQPLIKELREKFKDEPKKLQEETMRLYKERKVNPLGGCLPLLLQMPVLWALFYVFQRTIEFRGEEFIFWIKDLSAPDSPPVLPIVMGLSMYVQQKMTPTTDPRMAPMQFIMPVVLTIIFINFPAGLVLYWTVNNVMSILQQYYMKSNDKEVTKGGSAAAKGAKKNEQKKGKA